MHCLESQFDTVNIDRPLILQSLYLLHNSVCDRKILRWDFFLNCFDTLYIEAQITLERNGEVTFLKGMNRDNSKYSLHYKYLRYKNMFPDLKHLEGNLEYFSKKLFRVYECLLKSESGHPPSQKTLYGSLANKWPFKRTMSTPLLSARSSKKLFISCFVKKNERSLNLLKMNVSDIITDKGPPRYYEEKALVTLWVRQITNPNNFLVYTLTFFSTKV